MLFAFQYSLCPVGFLLPLSVAVLLLQFPQLDESFISYPASANQLHVTSHCAPHIIRDIVLLPLLANVVQFLYNVYQFVFVNTVPGFVPFAVNSYLPI